MSITTIKKRSFLPYLIASLVFFYIFHWLYKLYEASPSGYVPGDFFALHRLEWSFDHLFQKYWLDVEMTMQSISAAFFGMCLPLLFYMRPQVTGTFRYREEYGSARYVTFEELERLRDEEEDNNMIFSQTAQMGLFNKRLPYDRQINKNVLVIGGTGDSKTRSFVKPNALQLNSSYIFTDTKGLLVHELGHAFEKAGHQIKVFDVMTFLNSNKFNVFRYMRSELDIDRVAESIVTATKKSDQAGEDFWIQAQLLLLRCLIGYLYFDSQVSKYVAHLGHLADMARNLKSDPDMESVMEVLFEELEKARPGNYASKQWQLFNDLYTGETRNSIYAIVAAIVSVFDHDDVRRLIEDDNMEIETWNVKKTAVFINIPEINPAYQFLTALLFNTIFDVTFKTADDIIKGRKEGELLHLQVEADEFAQIGKIPNLPPLISVIRSREISIKIMIQSLSQVEELYGKNNTKTILNNCGTVLFLGSNDPDTLKWLSERSGKMTLNDRNSSESRSRQSSSSTQNSKLGRELLSPHEIATIGITEALVFVNRHNVYRDQKFDLDSHKRAHLLGNNPTDETWYRYVRYMSDIEEFKAHVRPSRVITLTEEEVEAEAS